jgi:hypothetical protein
LSRQLFSGELLETKISTSSDYIHVFASGQGRLVSDATLCESIWFYRRYQGFIRIGISLASGFS